MGGRDGGAGIDPADWPSSEEAPNDPFFVGGLLEGLGCRDLLLCMLLGLLIASYPAWSLDELCFFVSKIGGMVV